MTPPSRERMSVEELIRTGEAATYVRFEEKFRANIEQKMRNACFLPLCPPETRPQIVQHLEDIPNFNQYKGHLERMCAAAQTLRDSYDIAIGIARKGIWQSYIANLFGTQAYYVWIQRINHGSHILSPIDPLTSSSIRGKRVILMDNDVLTGGTLNVAADNLARASPAVIDALLIYKHTETDLDLYQKIKPSLRAPIIFGERNGKIIMDTTAQLRAPIRKVITLEHDFTPCANAYAELKRRLQ